MFQMLFGLAYFAFVIFFWWFVIRWFVTHPKATQICFRLFMTLIGKRLF